MLSVPFSYFKRVYFMKEIIITVIPMFLVMCILCKSKQRALKEIINQDGLTLLLSEKNF